MSLRVFLGWVIGLLGLLVILDVFGISFGVHAPFSALANAIVGVILIVIGVSLASGRPALTG